MSLGSGTGTGAGPGQGSGIGEGFGGGTGGGAYRPGNGVMLPKPLREVKPQYTADAMRAKVQGTVLLECVVLPDGTVGKVEIVRSLDSAFGLDQEAIKAAKQWRFAPGTRFGEPVAGTGDDRADLYPEVAEERHSFNNVAPRDDVAGIPVAVSQWRDLASPTCTRARSSLRLTGLIR